MYKVVEVLDPTINPDHYWKKLCRYTGRNRLPQRYFRTTSLLIIKYCSKINKEQLQVILYTAKQNQEILELFTLKRWLNGTTKNTTLVCATICFRAHVQSVDRRRSFFHCITNKHLVTTSYSYRYRLNRRRQLTYTEAFRICNSIVYTYWQSVIVLCCSIE